MPRRSAGVSPHPARVSPRSHTGRPFRLLTSLLVLAGTSTACAAPVAVPVPSTSAAVCAEATELLPSTIRNQERRETTPASDLTAAWGDPPVVWRCGVETPAALRPDSSLIEINGVTWFAEELTGGYRFTTLGLVADVELTVPNNYAPEAEVVVRLTPALAPLEPSE